MNLMSNTRMFISLLLLALLSLPAALRAGALELGPQKTGDAAPCADSADSCSAFPSAKKKPVLDLKPLPQSVPSVAQGAKIKVSSPSVKAAVPVVKAAETAPVKPLPVAPPAPQECAPCEIMFWKKVVAAAVLVGLALAAWKLYSLRKK